MPGNKRLCREKRTPDTSREVKYNKMAIHELILAIRKLRKTRELGRLEIFSRKLEKGNISCKVGLDKGQKW